MANVKKSKGVEVILAYYLNEISFKCSSLQKRINHRIQFMSKINKSY